MDGYQSHHVYFFTDTAYFFFENNLEMRYYNNSTFQIVSLCFINNSEKKYGNLPCKVYLVLRIWLWQDLEKMVVFI